MNPLTQCTTRVVCTSTVVETLVLHTSPVLILGH